MAPLVRRGWAPRGKPPQLAQKGRRREEVSVAATLRLPVGAGRPGLSFQTLPDGYFDSARTADSLGATLGLAGRAMVVVWDGGAKHKGDPIRQALRKAGRLERLPPYAPMLNPVESLWSWLKYGRPNHYAPSGAAGLNGRVVRELTAIRDDQELLRSFWEHSVLTNPLTLL